MDSLSWNSHPQMEQQCTLHPFQLAALGQCLAAPIQPLLIDSIVSDTHTLQCSTSFHVYFDNLVAFYCLAAGLGNIFPASFQVMT